MIKKLVTIFIIILFSFFVVETKNDEFLPSSISDLKKYYELVEIFEKRSLINKQQADDERRNCLELATKLVKRENLLTVQEFIEWNQRETIISFSNVIAVIAAITSIIALTFLGSIFIIPILIRIPVLFWVSGLFVISTSFMLLFNNSWLIFFGCLLFCGALQLMFNLYYAYHRNNGMKMAWILFIVWSFVALVKQNRESAYLATFALESILGFVMIKRSLSTAVGFHDEDKIPVATVSSFLLIIIGTMLHLQSKFNTIFDVFVRPFLFTGTFVYSIGLIILSSTYYVGKSKDLFWILQIISFLSGLAALFFGPLYGIPFLQSVGGTMLVFWLLEKYVEVLSWKNNAAVALNLLLFGLFLYVVAYLFKIYPQYFIFFN